MKFRTEIQIKDAPKNLDPERLNLLVGSCFSDNIGTRMQDAGWPATVNPCGTVYNPVSLAILFQLALTNPAMRREIISSGLTVREGRYVTWFMGSSVSGSTADECVENAIEAIMRIESAVEKAQAILITFGTSDVWLLKGTDRAVGNCHKHPASEFEKRRLGVEEIAELWEGIIETVRLRNPEVKFIFTVSPRRYLTEGMADNSRLKAILLLACDKICNSQKDAWYFPAYEILNDDLRDYRFYARDLLHPSEMATDYVWEKFKQTFLSEEGISRLEASEKEERRHRHRPIL